jgi:hypothetical protein
MHNRPAHKTSFIAMAFFLALLITGCGPKAASTPDAQASERALQAAGLQQTMTALAGTVQAMSAVQTEAARVTATPSITPSATGTPGPLVIQDDFSGDIGRWKNCGQCRIANGSLYMGPYPVTDSGQGYITLCGDCGIVQDFKIGVDAVYVEGYSDRGFGLVLREQDGAYVELEITTWQFYGVWYFDPTKQQGYDGWSTLLPGGWSASGYLHPAQLSNRIDVETATDGGKSTAAIRINGQLIYTVEIPSAPARVGLVVGLHSLGIAFDNFTFEGYPVDQQMPQDPSASRGEVAGK